MHDRIRSICGAVVLAVLLCLPPPAPAAAKETAVRAAFLFRLAFFVNWPASAFDGPTAPVRICVGAGSEALAATLAGQTATRTVQERPVDVVLLVPAAAAEGCHILYRERADELDPVPGPHTLVVAGSLAMLERGAALALVREESGGEARLVFHARRRALNDAGFTVSSKLLQLVRFDEDGG
jgi:hypothetical protein